MPPLQPVAPLNAVRTSGRRRALLVAGLVAAATLFASQACWLGKNVRIDDAYFTFSVAKNLALGHGPVYSRGERVEAYSNFLWMVLLAVPMVATRGEYAQTIARVVGVPFLVLLGWSVYCLVRRCSSSRVAAIAAVWLVAFDTDVATAWLIGLETVAYTALVAASLTAFVLSADTPRARHCAIWFAAAAALTRIDGFLLLGFMIAADAARTLRDGQPRPLARIARRCAWPVAVYAAWFAWRWRYYGLPLPTTYYAKALVPVCLPHRGIEYVTDQLRDSWLVAGLPAAAWLLVRRRAGRRC